MAKDFTNWHKLKARLEDRNHTPLFQEREIWWCSAGVNLGYEEDGKNELFERPILILKKFSKDFFWGVPFTSKVKEGKFYLQCMLQGKIRTVLLSQARPYSSKRLLRKFEKLSDSICMKVRSKIIKLYKK